jgi:hypothetical protein
MAMVITGFSTPKAAALHLLIFFNLRQDYLDGS